MRKGWLKWVPSWDLLSDLSLSDRRWPRGLFRHVVVVRTHFVFLDYSLIHIPTLNYFLWDWTAYIIFQITKINCFNRLRVQKLVILWKQWTFSIHVRAVTHIWVWWAFGDKAHISLCVQMNCLYCKQIMVPPSVKWWHQLYSLLLVWNRI